MHSINRWRILFVILFFPFYNTAQNNDDYYGAMPLRYEDYVYSGTIKSVLLHDENLETSQPIINLNSGQRLKFSFDELDADYKAYSYTFIHCNANWQPSNLLPIEYIDGFQENNISDYQYSFNTIQKYIHYSAVFPNNTCSFSKSGNYLLKVYENGQPDQVVITKRFMVYSNKIGITPRITRISDAVYNNYNQELDFVITYGDYQIVNPYSDLKVVITQNNRPDNAKSNLKPLFVKDGELRYELSDNNIFPGSNEFRYVNIKSIRYKSQRFFKISRDSLGNHIYLSADEKRSFKRYEFEPDINGNFLIKTTDGNNSDIEADYCHVHFFLPFEFVFTDGNLYVMGAFNGWQFNKTNLMRYNNELKGYEADIYLKQGYYDYQYAFLKDNSSQGDETLIEGTHFETENMYTIYVYHQQQGTFYEQLIGVKRISSGNR